jgi:ankyrin repeat protein
MIQTIGNSMANSVLEGTVPASAKKPGPTAARADREKFVKAKYADKAFVKPYRGISISQDFMTAIKNEDMPAAFTLLQQGADVNSIDVAEYRKTGLHHVAYNGDVAMMELLLLNGANANAIDETNNGWTPIHYCAVGNHSVLAALLFKRGAKLDIKDKKGRTPLDVAVDARHADCVTLLRLAVAAELERKEGGMDDRSFAHALASFSLDLTKTGARPRGRRPPAPSVSLPKSPVPDTTTSSSSKQSDRSTSLSNSKG